MVRHQKGCAVVALMIAVALSGVTAPAHADEGPIAGTVKSVDTAAGTLVIESASNGKVRQVTVHVRGDSKVVRFQRSGEAGKQGFGEQAAALGDIKPGWTVSVKTRHEGDREVAEIVRVVHEK